jgi:YVTN family beta-propeller protein
LTNISVGSDPNDVEYDRERGELFAVNLGSDNVSVINDTTDKIVAWVPVGDYPVQAGYDSEMGEVFVLNQNGNSISVINDTTNTVSSTFSPQTYPDGIVVVNSLGEIFVTNQVSGTVSVISDATNTVTHNISVGTWPNGLAYDSAKGEVFVANPESENVSVISVATNQVVATIPLANFPYCVTYDSATSQIFVGERSSIDTVVISDSTNSVVHTISGGNGPYAMAYDSGDGDVFVANWNDANITVISGATDKVVGNVPVGTNPDGVTYDSGNGYVYVSNYFQGSGQGTISVIAPNYPPPVTLHPKITAVPLSGRVPLLVNFSANVTNGTTPYHFTWNFGDGGNGSGVAIQHTFNSTGRYNVSLNVTDANGDIGKANVTVDVHSVTLQPIIHTSTLSGGVPLLVNFTAAVTGGVGPYQYLWKFGDGTPGSGITAQHLYNSTGMYNVTLTVVDAYGNYGQDNVTVAVHTVSLHPTINASPPSGGAPLFVNFTAGVTGGTGPYQYSWKFGDGTLGSGESVQHSYASTGTYNVTLTVIDPYGDTGQTYATVVVYTVPLYPTISAIPLTGAAPLHVSFSASVAGGTSPYQYSWKFGDGAIGSGEEAEHTYNSTGSFNVTLAVSDSNGDYGLAYTTIVVYPVPLHPTISAAPLTGEAPLPVSFTASVQSGMAPYLFSWAFGDDSVGTGAAVQHTYASMGTYDVALSVSDGNGDFGQANTTVVVYETPTGNESGNALELSISATPATGPAPLDVNLQATAEGGTGPYTFEWDFGDNSTAITGTDQVTSSVSHDYLVQGTYAAMVFVNDSTGRQAMTGVFISAYGSASSGQGQLVAFVTAMSTSGTAPLTVTFTPAVIGGKAPYQLSWAFGDGTPTVPESSIAPMVHTYAKAGTFSPELKVTDSLGATTSWSTRVAGNSHPVVVQAAPTKSSSSPFVPYWVIVVIVAVVVCAALLAAIYRRKKSMSLRQAALPDKIQPTPPSAPQLGREGTEPDPLADML